MMSGRKEEEKGEAGDKWRKWVGGKKRKGYEGEVHREGGKSPEGRKGEGKRGETRKGMIDKAEKKAKGRHS